MNTTYYLIDVPLMTQTGSYNMFAIKRYDFFSDVTFAIRFNRLECYIRDQRVADIISQAVNVELAATEVEFPYLVDNDVLLIAKKRIDEPKGVDDLEFYKVIYYE